MACVALIGLVAFAASRDAHLGRRPAGDAPCASTSIESIRLVRRRPLSRALQHVPFCAVHAATLRGVRAAPAESVAPAVRATVGVLLHALFVLAQFWLPALGWRLHYAPEACSALATHALVRPRPSCGPLSLVELYRTRSRLQISAHHVRLAAATPARAGRLPTSASLHFREPRLPTARPLRWYHARAVTGLASREHARLLDVHGPNECSLPPPSARRLLVAQLLAPLTIVQLATALLWCLDADVGRALMGMFSALSFEATTALASYRSALAVHRLHQPPPPVLALRDGDWAAVPARTLCPGDVFSLRAGARVPCDAVLMHGSALIDEASLTGEAVPQPKEGLPHAPPRRTAPTPPNAPSASSPGQGRTPDGLERLDDAPGGRHAGSALRGGTRALLVDVVSLRPSNAATPSPRASAARHVAFPPDGGVPCVAVRTGHRAAHGVALRAAARTAAPHASVASGAAETRESLIVVALMLTAGACACAYVARHARASSERALYVHCALILLSVVPADLPSQAALSVGAALRSLRAHGVLCVDPAALPAAGRVSCVAFDKTGTLIDDEPTLRGVIPASALHQPPAPSAKRRDGAAAAVVDARDAPWAARLALASCHALMPLAGAAGAAEAEALDGRTEGTARAAQPDGSSDAELSDASDSELSDPSDALGDPIERAALCALGCALSADGHATLLPQPAAQSARHMPNAAGTEAARGARQARVSARAPGALIELVAREPFSPDRRRMSVVVRVSAQPRDAHLPAGARGTWVFVKGAAEAIAALSGIVPPGYAAAHERAAARGERVLAIAARQLTRSEEHGVASGRLRPADVERGATVCGLALFRAAPHVDSVETVRRLRDAGLRTCVITGDALGTALWAARACGVLVPSARVACLAPAPATSAKGRDDDDDDARAGAPAGKERPTLRFVELSPRTWQPRPGRAHRVPPTAAGVRVFARTYALAATGDALDALAATLPEAHAAVCARASVLARIAPQAKATAVRAIEVRRALRGVTAPAVAARRRFFF